MSRESLREILNGLNEFSLSKSLLVALLNTELEAFATDLAS